MKKTIILFSFLAVVLMAGAAFASTFFFRTDNKEFGTDPAFYKGLGNELVQSGDFENAATAYEKALELGEDYNIRSNLAVLYYQNGAFSNAISHLRVLVAAFPESPSYHYDLAVNLVDKFRNTDDKKIEDLYEALAEYEEANALSSGFSNSVNNIAALRRVLGKDVALLVKKGEV